MNIDFSVVMKSLNGESIKDAKGEPVKLKDICITALNNAPEDWLKVDPKEKYKRGHLAQAIYSSDVLDISAQDIVMIKELVGKQFSPHLVKAVWDIIDPGDHNGK